MGLLQKDIKNEALYNTTLWQLAGTIVTKETAKRKDYVHVETVLKIVEEMKKEFPFNPDDLVWNKKHQITDLQNSIRKMREWFERWLGDEQP